MAPRRHLFLHYCSEEICLPLAVLRFGPYRRGSAAGLFCRRRFALARWRGRWRGRLPRGRVTYLQVYEITASGNVVLVRLALGLVALANVGLDVADQQAFGRAGADCGSGCCGERRGDHESLA